MTQVLGQNENKSSIKMAIGWCKYALANNKASTGVEIGIVEIHRSKFLTQFLSCFLIQILSHFDQSCFKLSGHYSSSKKLWYTCLKSFDKGPQLPYFFGLRLENWHIYSSRHCLLYMWKLGGGAYSFKPHPLL